MELNTFIHFTLSIYAVFLVLDIIKAYKDKRHYELKYFEVRPDKTFTMLLLHNQKWSIIGVMCVMFWVELVTSMLG